MNDIKNDDRRFSFKMPSRLYEKLRREAFKREKSIGEIIRHLLNESLARSAKDKDAM